MKRHSGKGPTSYRLFILLIAALALLLAACGRQEVEPNPSVEETPLLTDADFEEVELELGDALVLLDPVEGQRSELPDEALESQAVLSGASGLVAYIRHQPGSSTRPWNIFLGNQSTDAKTRIYSGTREIQSVATRSNGNTLVFAMRETASTTSDFEIYRYIVSTAKLTRLTNNSVDDTNVSMSASGAKIVWESRSSYGRGIVLIRDGSSTSQLCPGYHYDCFEPSVSGNGAQIALVQKTSSAHKVLVYTFATSSSLEIFTPSSGKVPRHPSVNNNNNRVMWLERSTSEGSFSTRQIKVKNLSTGAVTTVLDESVSFGLDHPHLTSDAAHLTYTRNSGSCLDIYTRSLSTGSSARHSSCWSPDNHYAPFWQK